MMIGMLLLCLCYFVIDLHACSQYGLGVCMWLVDSLSCE